MISGILRISLKSNSPVSFVTELRLLRMEPILARSMLSTGAAASDEEAVKCVTGCSVTPDGSVFAGNEVDTTGIEGRSFCSSTGE